jgi:polysaccharide biosynthesis protein PelE
MDRPMNASLPIGASCGPAPASRLAALVHAAMLAVSFGAVSAELGIALAGLHAFAPPPSLLLAHLAVCGALGGAAAVFRRYGGRDAGFLLLVVATAALGPMGAAGASFSAALRCVFARRSTPFERWYASLFPEMAASPTRALYQRIALRGAGPAARSTVAPFGDVIALGTVQEKQSVVTMVADAFRPAFAPALRSALNDSEPAIRVQAATASARIENRFLERSMALEERRAATPGDADALLALARHHDEYADTGMLDTSRAQGERRQALEHSLSAERLRPGDPQVTEAIGRLLLRLGEFERAAACLEREVERPDASAVALGCYLECLYQLRDLQGLRDAARRHQDRIAASDLPELREAVRLWAGGTPDDLLAKRYAA